MKILVTGAGRGGTNLATELVRSLNIVNFTKAVEDRKLFEYKEIPDLYATKLATENRGFNEENIIRLLEENKDMYVIFVTRHPVDNCLSKIFRGRPMSEGGDSTVNETASDGTKEGSVKALKHMYSMYNIIIDNFPNRILHLKMEDIIKDKDTIFKNVCDFLGVNDRYISDDFFKNNRNVYQKKRYGNKLDSSVIGLYENIDECFGGYFKDKSDYVDYMLVELDGEIKKLGYND